MTEFFTPDSSSPSVLHLYDLHDEKPNWPLAFDAKLSLYAKGGLQDFLAYLDSILDMPGCGEATREKYQSKRDEVALELDRRADESADNREVREFVYPNDFND